MIPLVLGKHESQSARAFLLIDLRTMHSRGQFLFFDLSLPLCLECFSSAVVPIEIIVGIIIFASCPSSYRRLDASMVSSLLKGFTRANVDYGNFMKYRLPAKSDNNDWKRAEGVDENGDLMEEYQGMKAWPCVCAFSRPNEVRA